MHNLFDFLKLKQHIIKMHGKQVNQLYKKLLIKFFHRYPLILQMDSRNKLSTPYKKGYNSFEKYIKMFNNIVNERKITKN